MEVRTMDECVRIIEIVPLNGFPTGMRVISSAVTPSIMIRSSGNTAKLSIKSSVPGVPSS